MFDKFVVIETDTGEMVAESLRDNWHAAAGLADALRSTRRLDYHVAPAELVEHLDYRVRVGA